MTRVVLFAFLFGCPSAPKVDGVLGDTDDDFVGQSGGDADADSDSDSDADEEEDSKKEEE